MGENTSTSTQTPTATAAHVAEAIYCTIEGPTTSVRDDSGTAYELELVADKQDKNVVSITAWTSDKDGDDVELGVFRVTVEQVI
jgi:hypothetical protein